jgi:hypothetical protein
MAQLNTKICSNDSPQSQPASFEGKSVRRRTFLQSGLFAAAALLLRSSPNFDSWIEAAQAASIDLVHDTLNGLLAFVVPGPDVYSVGQGVSTPQPGGVDAHVAEVLIDSLDLSAPYLPNFSATVAAILNNLAQAVNPAAGGAFLSPFAPLSFPEKVAVFQIMDGDAALSPLAGILLAAVAYLSYSEAGVFDRNTRSLTGQPVGWTISSYAGVADGRDEFKGYFENRRNVE